MELDAWLRVLGALTPLLAALGALASYLALRKKQSAEGDGVIVDSAKNAVAIMDSMMERLEERVEDLERQLETEKHARAADREECNKQLLALQQWGEQKEAEHCERTIQLEDKVNRLTEALSNERELRIDREHEMDEMIERARTCPDQVRAQDLERAILAHPEESKPYPVPKANTEVPPPPEYLYDG